MKSLYVYAVLAGGAGVTPGAGVARERVRVSRCGTVFVAVGAVPAVPALSARTVRAHDAVVRRLAVRAPAVLPVRFGTVFADRAALFRSLRAREGALREALELVDGREQMTLRLYGKTGQPTDEDDVAESRGDAAAADVGNGAGGVGTRYLTRRARLQRIPALTRLRPFLASVVVAERVERQAVPPLLASAYHLIPRGASEDYRAALARARRALGPVRVHVTGPWPAYAFTPGPGA